MRTCVAGRCDGAPSDVAARQRANKNFTLNQVYSYLPATWSLAVVVYQSGRLSGLRARHRARANAARGTHHWFPLAVAPLGWAWARPCGAGAGGRNMVQGHRHAAAANSRGIVWPGDVFVVAAACRRKVRGRARAPCVPWPTRAQQSNHAAMIVISAAAGNSLQLPTLLTSASGMHAKVAECRTVHSAAAAMASSREPPLASRATGTGANPLPPPPLPLPTGRATAQRPHVHTMRVETDGDFLVGGEEWLPCIRCRHAARRGRQVVAVRGHDDKSSSWQ